MENAFGIYLASRFRVLKRPLNVAITKVETIVKTTMALHNWLKLSSPETYTPAGYADNEDLNSRYIIPGIWRTHNSGDNSLGEFIASDGSHNGTTSAADVRAAYTEYFSGKGAVPWQSTMIYDD